MPIDPMHYPNDSGGMAQYLTDLQKIPRYSEQPKQMQDMILDQARKRWTEVHAAAADRREALRSMYQAEYLGGAPTEGTYDWWSQNVAKRIQRGTEAGITTLFRGPTAGQQAWQHPEQFPHMRMLAKATPFFGADTGSGEIFGAMLLGLGPAAGAMGLGIGEAATWGGVAARGVGQIALGAGLGAAAYGPEAYAHDDPMALAKGAVGGGLAGAINVPAELATNALLAKSYESELGRALEPVLPNIAKDLKTGDDIAANAFPTIPDPVHGSVTPWEAKALDNVGTSRSKVISEVGDEPVNLRLTPEEIIALRESKLQPPGVIQRPMAPAASYRTAATRVGPTTAPTLRNLGPSALASVKEWVEFMAQVGKKGWDVEGGLIEKNGAGVALRALYRRWMDDVIGPAIDQLMRAKAGRFTADAGNWMLDEYNVMGARMYSRLIQKAMAEGGRITPSVLQKLVTDPGPEGWMKDIIENGMPFRRSATDNPGLNFIRQAMRGAPAWAKRDIEANARIFTSIRPGFLLGRAFGGPLAMAMGGLRLGINPTMPYRAGQIALSSGLAKLTLPMAARIGVNGLYQALLHYLEPDQEAVEGAR